LISDNADYPVAEDEQKIRGDYLIYAKNADNITFNNTVAEIRRDFPGKWKGITKFESCEGVTINGGNL